MQNRISNKVLYISILCAIVGIFFFVGYKINLLNFIGIGSNIEAGASGYSVSLNGSSYTFNTLDDSISLPSLSDSGESKFVGWFLSNGTQVTNVNYKYVISSSTMLEPKYGNLISNEFGQKCDSIKNSYINNIIFANNFTDIGDNNIDVSNLTDGSIVASFHDQFSYQGQTLYNVIIVHSEDYVVAPQNCAMFFSEYFTNVTSIYEFDLFRTPITIDMTYMFYNTTLISIDVGHFDTSSVTSMDSMFKFCDDLEELNGINEWDVSNVISIYNMFHGAMSLRSINLNKWNTHSLNSAESAFFNCSNLTDIDVSGWDLSSAGSFKFMFGNGIFTSININGWHDSAPGFCVNYMFACNSNLRELNLTSWNNISIYDASNMFDGCNKLEHIYSGELNISLGDEMFLGCTLLSGAINYSSTKISAAYANPTTGYFTIIYSGEILEGDNQRVNMNALLYSRDSDEKASGNITYVIDYPYSKFQNCTFGSTGLTDFYYAKAGNGGKTVIDLNETFIRYAHTWSGRQVVKAYFNDRTIDLVMYLDKSILSCNFLIYMGIKSNESSIDNSVEYINFYINETLFDSLVVDNSSVFDVSSNMWGGNETGYVKAQIVNNGGGKKTINVIAKSTIVLPSGTNNMFSYLTALKDINFNNVVVSSSIRDAYGLFRNDISLTSTDFLIGMKFTHLKGAGQVFAECSGLERANITMLSLQEVEKMGGFFADCTNLRSVDISGINASKLDAIPQLFWNCSNLTAIDLTVFENAKLTDIRGFLSGCDSLETLIGYENLDVSRVSNFSYTFHHLDGVNQSLSLNLSSWDVSSGTTFEKMFGYSSGIKNLDLSTWNTTNAVNMAAMFTDSGVKILDLSSFDTRNVENMFAMFRSCKNLTTIYSEGFNTSSVVDDTDMFLYSDYLIGGISYSSSKISSEYAKPITGYFSIKRDLAFISGENQIFSPYGVDKVIFRINADINDFNSIILDCFGVVDPSEYSLKEENGTTVVELNYIFLSHFYEREFKTYSITFLIGGDHIATNFQTTSGGFLSPIWRELIGVTINFSDFDNNVYKDYSIKTIKFDTNVARYSLIKANGGANGEDIFNVGCTYWDEKNINDRVYAVIEIDDDNMKTVTFVAEGVIGLPYYFDNGFGNLVNLISIQGVDKVYAGKSRYLSSLFRNDSNLTSLNLSSFDTGFALQLSSMFMHCDKLESLDVSGFDTSNADKMQYMFAYCSSLTSLNLSNFDTSKCDGFNSMFISCTKLASLDISSFNTRSAITLSYMFYECESLTTLDVSSFNTTSVVSMEKMFTYCSNLVSLNVSGFDTGNVTNMYSMFNGCKKIDNLDVSNWNTINVTNMANMFYDCNTLQNLDVSKWITINVNNMAFMFFECNTLQNLDVSKWNTVNVTSMSGMFYNCKNLQSIDVSKFSTNKVTNMYRMFYNCVLLKTIDVSLFETGNVTNMSGMFYNCVLLKTIDVSLFETGNVTNMAWMFNNCANLTSLNLTNFVIKENCNMTGFVSYLHSLENIGISASAAPYVRENLSTPIKITGFTYWWDVSSGEHYNLSEIPNVTATYSVYPFFSVIYKDYSDNRTIAIDLRQSNSEYYLRNATTLVKEEDSTSTSLRLCNNNVYNTISYDRNITFMLDKYKYISGSDVYEFYPDDLFGYYGDDTIYAIFNSTYVSSSVELPTLSRDGYIFRGWNADNEASSGVIGNITPTHDGTVLYAIWEPILYKITFNPLNGTLVGSSSKDVFYGSSIGSMPSVNYSDGKSFAGWMDDLTNGNIYESTTTYNYQENITLYALSGVRENITLSYGNWVKDNNIFNRTNTNSYYASDVFIYASAGDKIIFKNNSTYGFKYYRFVNNYGSEFSINGLSQFEDKDYLEPNEYERYIDEEALSIIVNVLQDSLFVFNVELYSGNDDYIKNNAYVVRTNNSSKYDKATVKFYGINRNDTYIYSGISLNNINESNIRMYNGFDSYTSYSTNSYNGERYITFNDLDYSKPLYICNGIEFNDTNIVKGYEWERRSGTNYFSRYKNSDSITTYNPIFVKKGDLILVGGSSNLKYSIQKTYTPDTYNRWSANSLSTNEEVIKNQYDSGKYYLSSWINTTDMEEDIIPVMQDGWLMIKFAKLAGGNVNDSDETEAKNIFRIVRTSNENEYKMNRVFYQGTSATNKPNHALSGDDIVFDINSGLEQNLTILMGDKTLSSSEYSYNNHTGELIIDHLDGDLYIINGYVEDDEIQIINDKYYQSNGTKSGVHNEINLGSSSNAATTNYIYVKSGDIVRLNDIGDDLNYYLHFGFNRISENVFSVNDSLKIHYFDFDERPLSSEEIENGTYLYGFDGFNKENKVFEILNDGYLMISIFKDSTISSSEIDRFRSGFTVVRSHNKGDYQFYNITYENMDISENEKYSKLYKGSNTIKVDSNIGDYIGVYINDTLLSSGYSYEQTGILTINNVNGNVNIYKPNIYTVNFNSDGGSSIESMSFSSRIQSVSGVSNPIKVGNSFVGWYINNETLFKNGKTYDYNGTINAVARWSDQAYTVTFVIEDGNVSPSSKQVNYNALYGELPVPTRSGYTFAGWYKENTLINKVTNESIVSVSADHYLYAKWENAKYSVTLNMNGKGSNKIINVTYNESFDLGEDPIAGGYTFKEWNMLNDGSGQKITNDLISTITNNSTVIYAIWSPNNYTISFDSNGGIAVNDVYNVTYGDLIVDHISVMPTTTKLGYTFNGWCYNNQKVNGGTNYTFAFDMLLVANYTANNYTISFNSNGGSSVESKDITYGENIPTLSSPSKTGSVFDGWYDSQSYTHKVNSGDVYNYPQNSIFYAKWVKIDYVITFKYNNENADSQRTINYMDSINNLPVASKTGYKFLGWYDDNSTGQKIVEGSSYNNASNLTLYARYETIKYNIHDVNRRFIDQNISYDETYSVPSSFSKANGYSEITVTYDSVNGEEINKMVTNRVTTYTFSNITCGNEVYYPLDTITIKGDMEVNVNFSESYSYQTITLPSSVVKEGYVFKGWHTSEDRNTILNGSYLVTKNITLYALYDRNYTYEVIEGNNQTINVIPNGNSKNATFVIDGNYDLFESLTCNNITLIRDVDYKVYEGSTIIVLTPSGLNKIGSDKEGKHQLIAKFIDVPDVKIDSMVVHINPPKTGDNILIYIGILISSLLGIIIIKRKTH